MTLSDSCVAPYYDENGFSGMADISYNIASLYQQITKNEMAAKRVNFILNDKGEVILSSEKGGLFAASDTPVDLRRAEERDLAAVKEDVNAHAAGTEPSDDVTMLGLVYNS